MFTEFFAIVGLCATLAADILGGNVDRNLYPNTAVVTAIDYGKDSFTVVTSTNISYTLKGVEDWEVGDLASLLMYDIGGDGDITNDLVIELRYTGFTVDF
jgi:hypothetical protein